MNALFGLVLVYLSLLISPSFCTEKADGNTLTKQILENLDTQQLKDALQQFIDENNLDIDVSNLTAFYVWG